jgi:hypothetical protein
MDHNISTPVTSNVKEIRMSPELKAYLQELQKLANKFPGSPSPFDFRTRKTSSS